MKEIKLTQGKVALVDDEDFEIINQFKWHISKDKHTCYAIRHTPMIDGKRTKILMHRQILQVNNSNVMVDHKDHNGLNCQKNNIRICSQSQNLMNQKKRNGLSSKFKGVYYDKRKKKWKAQIKLNRKEIFLGYFDLEINAAKSYDTKARELYGEFANPNF